MERLKKLRAPVGSRITKLAEDIRIALQGPSVSKEDFELKLSLLTSKASVLADMDREIAAVVADDQVESEAQSCGPVPGLID